jgi:ABC-type transport system involved in multi-copper enzyme maturation permease subunit
MAKGSKIALVLGIGVVALIILALVLIVIFFINVVSGPADVANNYVKALNNGDLSTAWSYLAAETQKEEGRSGFEDKVGGLRGEISKWSTGSINVRTGGLSTVVMNLTLKDGTKVTWDMSLTKENGKWKIRQVSPRQ